MTTIPDRVSRLEGAYEQVDRRLGDLNESIEDLRSQMRATDSKIDELQRHVDGKMDGLRGEIDAKINALIIVTGTVGVAIVGGMIALALRV